MAKKTEIIYIPNFKYFTINEKGNPKDDTFIEYIGVLCSLSYAVKISVKKGIESKGYFDYAVYSLEEIYDINEEARKCKFAKLDKNELVFKLMI